MLSCDVAEHIRSDLCDHNDLAAGAGGGCRLVGALSAGAEFDCRAENGLSVAGEAGRKAGNVGYKAADNNYFTGLGHNYFPFFR